jgi:DNA-binding beta-propeller fold protein YncE
MTRWTTSFGFALVLALGACTDRSDVCDEAKPGEACRWAGTGQQGYNREHPTLDRLDSPLNQPSDVTFAHDGRGYITDWNNHMIRRVEHDQTLVRVVGTEYEGDGSPEMEDRLPACSPAGFIGNGVALNHPVQTRFNPADGLLYIAAWHNNKIRTFDPKSGITMTYAGDFYGFTGDGGPACKALFNQPSSLAFEPDGTMFVSDQRNVRLRKIAPDGTISTIGGNGTEGNIGDGGPVQLAEFGWDTSNTPEIDGGLAIDDTYLYIADSRNHRIRRVDLATGVIDCIGNMSAQPGYTGDGGPAINATFNDPFGIALSPDHNLYIADRGNNVVRMIDLSSNIVTTVVGDGTLCDTSIEQCPDHAPALEMELNKPYGVSFDGSGHLYVADTFNHRVLKVLK